MGNTAESQIKDWLSKTGYPLEFYVADLFKKHGFNVDKSMYYLDLNSKEIREIDIIAFLDEYKNGFSFRFLFVIECKVIKGKSVIAFTDEDRRINSVINVFFKANSLGQKFLENVNFRNEAFRGIRIDKSVANSLKLCPIVKEKNETIKNEKENNKDVIYEAYRQVTKASEYLLNLFDDDKIHLNEKNCIIIFPMIIIDGELYNCSHNGSEMEIRETNHLKYLTHNPTSRVKMDLIDVCDKNSLEELIINYKKGIKVFFEDEIFQSFLKNNSPR